MTAQFLQVELSNLIQESKRRNTELRDAAGKSLEDLRSLHATSEVQLAADLNRRPNFVTPFLLACGTKNAKLIAIAVSCLQRLIVSKALARERLKDVLEGLKETVSQGLDVQLKILQALPSLLQNYADELGGELLGSTLLICSTLQGSKNGIVNNTAAATLQQLVVSVFDKVSAEDQQSAEGPVAGQVSIGEESVDLLPAALDAYKVFNDVCLLTEGQKPEFLKFAMIPQSYGLELIESVLTNHAELFLSHLEQGYVLRVRVMPFLLSLLASKQTFPTTVRIMRILYILLRRHLTILVSEGEAALDMLTRMLDPDNASPWKRVLSMEVFRGIYAEPGLIRKIYSFYDERNEQKDIVRNQVSALVRIATEKPSIIGLGHQSTIPGQQSASKNQSDEQAIMEAGGVAGMIGGAVSVQEGSGPGISTQWSSVRVPCIDHLDKAEAPNMPESYIYNLTLACINNFSDGLARFVLPLTIPNESRGKRRTRNPVATEQENSTAPLERVQSSTPDPKELSRKRSTRKMEMPINPLSLVDHVLYGEIRTSAAIIESCWPAILAACSTFLYAALDNEFYHSLIRSIQKFTQVSGLLRLSTPRDAFLTTLGKAAVPSNVLAATVAASPATPALESPSILSDAKGFLTTDRLMSPLSPTSDKFREPLGTTLSSRNLLCLRALLNLGIALGPTLDRAWTIILETLRQSDFILHSSKQRMSRQGTQKQDGQPGSDDPSMLLNIGSEVKAVELAALRMFESTADFPDKSFVVLLQAFCGLLEDGKAGSDDDSTLAAPKSASSPKPGLHRRLPSMSGVSTSAASHLRTREDPFVITKLGELATINMNRLTSQEPSINGWEYLTGELVWLACSTSAIPIARTKSAEALADIVVTACASVMAEPEEIRGKVQLRSFSSLSTAINSLQYRNQNRPSQSYNTDLVVHGVFLEALRSVLEQCGETLVSGWDLVFQILASAFEERHDSVADSATVKRTTAHPHIWRARSTALVRSSFSSLQLICSDFLSSVPSSCMLAVVEMLYKFCSQEDELNISLTTVTFFWTVSDFLQGDEVITCLNGSRFSKVRTEQAWAELVTTGGSDDSDAALWMLLLVRLTAVTTDQRSEVRNGAIQTLMRIFDAYGDQFGPHAWRTCLVIIVQRMMDDNYEQQQGLHSSNSEDKDVRSWNETTNIISSGVAGLYSDYLHIFIQQQDFVDSWQNVMNYFEQLLSLERVEVSATVFTSLHRILSRVDAAEKLGAPSLQFVWNIWAQGMPLDGTMSTAASSNNQPALVAYAQSFQEIYRLLKENITQQRLQKSLAHLYDCIVRSDGEVYSNDIDHLTPLQDEVLQILKIVRTDLPGMPATLIKCLSSLVVLPYSNQDSGQKKKKLTFVALSKASMDLLSSKTADHFKESEIYTSEAFSSALDALALAISRKYVFPDIGKGSPLWMVATKTALEVLYLAISHVQVISLSDSDVQKIWESIVKVGIGIASADVQAAGEKVDVLSDEEVDISSFSRFRGLITPALGAANIPDRTRRRYTESLFNNSILHKPEVGELPESGGEILAGLYDIRQGKVNDPLPTRRNKMSFVCLHELFDLVARHDGSAERIRLAQAASPFLILRAGITLRAYIADQPLRGLMPQPSSQRRELTSILNQLQALECEPRSIPDAPGVVSDSKKHLHRLFPLISKAVRVAWRDQETLEMLGKLLDEVGVEMGVD